MQCVMDQDQDIRPFFMQIFQVNRPIDRSINKDDDDNPKSSFQQ